MDEISEVLKSDIGIKENVTRKEWKYPDLSRATSRDE